MHGMMANLKYSNVPRKCLSPRGSPAHSPTPTATGNTFAWVSAAVPAPASHFVFGADARSR